MSRIIIWDMGRHGQHTFAAQDDAELEASARHIVTLLAEPHRQYIYDAQPTGGLTPEMVETTKATLKDWPVGEANRLISVMYDLVAAQERRDTHCLMQARHFEAAQQIAAGTFTGSAWDILQERSGAEYETYYLGDLYVPDTDDQ